MLCLTVGSPGGGEVPVAAPTLPRGQASGAGAVLGPPALPRRGSLVLQGRAGSPGAMPWSVTRRGQAPVWRAVPLAVP